MRKHLQENNEQLGCYRVINTIFNQLARVFSLCYFLIHFLHNFYCKTFLLTGRLWLNATIITSRQTIVLFHTFSSLAIATREVLNLKERKAILSWQTNRYHVDHWQLLCCQVLVYFIIGLCWPGKKKNKKRMHDLWLYGSLSVITLIWKANDPRLKINRTMASVLWVPNAPENKFVNDKCSSQIIC